LRILPPGSKVCKHKGNDSKAKQEAMEVRICVKVTLQGNLDTQNPTPAVKATKIGHKQWSFCGGNYYSLEQPLRGAEEKKTIATVKNIEGHVS
jgi:hypothetical protein